MVPHMILPITIMEVIVVDFWFFFKIAADAKQKHKSEILEKIHLSLFWSNRYNYHRNGQLYYYSDVGGIVLLMS